MICGVYQSLIGGLEPTEAATSPIWPGSTWTLAEIDHLLFVLHLVEQRRLLS